VTDREWACDLLNLSVDRPIFIIGSGRSGTTIVFEALAPHPDVGWLSNYSARFQRLGSLADLPFRIYGLPIAPRRGEKPQHSQGFRRLNRLRPKPAEDYRTWNRLFGAEFDRSYLIGETAEHHQRVAATKRIARLLRIQGRNRFLAKLTGPPRIGFLASVFPDALFLNVVRDGRAVVGSLLNVHFWKEGGGYERPWWEGGLPSDWEREWEAYDRSPLALAAIQWRRIVEVTEEESERLPASQYVEVRYEDFVNRATAVAKHLIDQCGLQEWPQLEEWLGQHTYQDFNHRTLERFSSRERQQLDVILGPTLHRLGYA
jgi:hypothetical protein